ncbi:MAG: hypothetical protein H5T86_06110 [Armatimonadetes bacterium]|nr:hypothetical protein [Armatimonadota bacterium]
MRLRLIGVLCAVLAIAAGSRGEILIFDMGTADSAVWPGAKAVNPVSRYSDDQGFGWASLEGLKAYDRPLDSLVDREGRKEPPPVWTNPITQDVIVGDRDNAFAFKAAPGEWKVFIRCGISTDIRWQYWDFDVAAGQEKWSCKIAGSYQYKSQTFTVLSDGTVRIALQPRSKWLLCCVVAWQSEDEAAARELIDKIEQWAPDDELAKWKEDPRPPAGPDPPLSDTDRKRGFYVWHRHWGEIVYPWTNPVAEEINPTLRVFAAPGEYEPMTFCVRPLRPIKDFQVVPSAIGPVPASAIEVRKVRYMSARPNYTVRYRYRIVPDVLERWTGGPLPPNENARFWLTLHVPETARPGLYSGAVRIVADGVSTAIPVNLRILDVRLEEDPEHTYGIYYHHSLDGYFNGPDDASREYWRRRAEMEHADMAAHGTRNVVLGCWFQPADESGKFNVGNAFELLQAKLDLAKKYGFYGPYALSFNTNGVYYKYLKEMPGSHLAKVKMPPDEFFEEITAMVRTIEEERRRRGWPEFVYYPVDEPGTGPQAVAFMVRVLQAVRAAGVRTYVTADPTRPAFEPMRPYVDIWCTQPFLPGREAILADMKERRVEYWCYPNHVNGENDHTPVAGARMTYGFGFWRSGFLRLIPWIYSYTVGDPFNYLDGSSSDFFNRHEPDGRPIPVCMWEAYREGYDDYRYIYSLQQAIRRAKQSRSAEARQEAAAAEKTLEFVWKSIPVLPKYKYEGFWTPEEMDVYRWLIARRLERLSRLLR